MRFKDKRILEELVDEFGRDAGHLFPLDKLVEHVHSKGVKASRDEIGDAAGSSEYLFEVDPDFFCPRRTFFQNAQFRITPLKEEVEGGYLLPGHRFIPFVSREVFPPDAQLLLPDGSSVKTRKRPIPQPLAMSCLHFYGPGSAIDYLVFDDESNARRLVPPYTADVTMTTFDLRRFYKSSGFRPGDSLMVKVVDWLKGLYSIVRAEAASDLVAARKWTDSMELALCDALDELETNGDCYEQLALAMRNAQEDCDCISLMENPPMALAAYFNLQQRLSVQTLGERALFWEKDGDLREEAVLDKLDNPPEPESELDAYFQLFGLSLSEGEVEAYMRDALFRGEEAGLVLARTTAGRHLLFSSAEDQERFHQLWDELWDDVKADYDPANDPFGAARSQMLLLNDKILATLRQLDACGAGMEILSSAESFELGHVSSMVSAALVLFNHPGEGEASPDMLVDMMPNLEKAIDRLTKSILSDAAKKANPKKKVLKKKGDSGAIYQLKISLKGAKPPIWRRILIPADMELINLHAAIQAAMGWENCHLHQFKKGRTFFMPEPENDGAGFSNFDTEDSTGVRIDQLLCAEKDKIEYEYDFGDSWDHEVLLEKVLEPAAGTVYPVCVKGKGACPPEDCGGLWGYYNLLEILGDPEDEEHEGMLAWAGGPIDPAAFDLDEANARLREWFK